MTHFLCLPHCSSSASQQQTSSEQPRAQQRLEYSYTKAANSKCSINSNSQNKSLMVEIYRWDGPWSNLDTSPRTETHTSRQIHTQRTATSCMKETYCAISPLLLVLKWQWCSLYYYNFKSFMLFFIYIFAYKFLFVDGVKWHSWVQVVIRSPSRACRYAVLSAVLRS